MPPETPTAPAVAPACDGDDPAAGPQCAWGVSPLGELFACHAVPTTNAYLCAGWLAVYGADHPIVRLGIALGLVDQIAQAPGEDWPALWDSAAEMLAAIGPDAPGAARHDLGVHP